MSEARIWLPKKLKPVFLGPADVRGAYGGRGSAKTRSFAKMIAVRGYQFGMSGTSGILVCARQFMNSLEDSSLEEVKRAIEEEPFLSAYYDVGEKYIKSKDGRISFAFCGLDRSILSLKSKGRILILWIDEGEPVTGPAFDIVEPTLREEGSDWNAELWLTWNPARKSAAVERYRRSNDPRIKIVELNWRDNPKFPETLERKRIRCLEEEPHKYDHIWEGGYLTLADGAYFAKQLADAKAGGRISKVAADPLLSLRAYVDIGGTGARADAFAMWIVQFVGREVRVLNYYEAVGQELAAHVQWLRDNGYEKVQIVLPHDGASNDKVYAVSYESALRSAGFSVRVIPNMGKGAAAQRIEAVRRIMPNVWFDEAKTEPGREALGWYHPKKDDKRQIDLGPEHDWSSHGADAFGLMAVDYEQNKPQTYKQLNYPKLGVA